VARRFLEALEAPDGARTDFTAPSPYLAGTLRAFRNGRLVATDQDDGFLELAPAAGTFRMRRAPLTGDTLFAFYEEA